MNSELVARTTECGHLLSVMGGKFNVKASL